jgi:hypothetical protein
VEHRDSARCAVEEVDDVVELRGEAVNVLPVDRRDEAAVDPRADVVREHIRFVFYGLDGGDVVIEPVRLGEQAIQETRCFLESLRQLVEENEKAFVAWDEAHGVSSEVAKATRRPLNWRGAGFVTQPRQT